MNPHTTGPQAFADAVQHVSFGPVSAFQNLSIVPLLSPTEREVEYLTLDEALAGGWAQITEVSDAGQVSELKVVVKGDRPVLLVDGEELVGAKQNRVLNLTILVPAPSTTPIPVSCVESGRWQHRSAAFASSPRAQFAEGRAARVSQVTELAHGCRPPTVRIRAPSGASSRRSPPGSARPRLRRRCRRSSTRWERRSTSSWRRSRRSSTRWAPCSSSTASRRASSCSTPRARGASCRRSWCGATRWMRWTDATANGSRRRMGTCRTRSPARWRRARLSAFPAAGEGEDVRLTGRGIAGAALVARGRAVHVSAFPQHV